ncbi:MAG: hypothetical protein PQJ60_12235 [Spirochaetales bacterium]|nr:hypothetical protein [Spirochaetales bacterium]
MPFKLIGFILFVVIIFAFIGFNLDNRTDINIWVNEKGHYEDVSVIVVVFAAYLFGLLSTVPFWFARSLSKGRARKKEKNKLKKAEIPVQDGQGSSAVQKKKILPGRKKKDEEVLS